MEQNLQELEKRTAQLEKKERAVYNKIKELESELDILLKKEKPVCGNFSSEKANHLAEVNEEMFRQNVRLRSTLSIVLQKMKSRRRKRTIEHCWQLRTTTKVGGLNQRDFCIEYIFIFVMKIR
ncbi:hypothetical protein [Virgibacillus kimchii]